MTLGSAAARSSCHVSLEQKCDVGIGKGRSRIAPRRSLSGDGTIG